VGSRPSNHHYGGRSFIFARRESVRSVNKAMKEDEAFLTERHLLKRRGNQEG
jgi:hypothetical protein